MKEPDATTAAPSEGAPEARAALAVPSGRRALADEWALVLASQGVAASIQPGPAGFVLVLAAGDLERARGVIERYQQENPPRPPGADECDALADAAAAEPATPPGVAGLIFGIAIIAMHAAIGEPGHGHSIFERGSADAARIMAGEWWRCVTALCLHADLAHVVGNALFGLYFITAVCALLGSGLGLSLVLAAGAIGNGLNALTQSQGHDSIGASTAVFGAIGVLAGLALARRQRAGLRGKRLLLPIGAGLGLLAMLGTSGARVDVFAHLDGLLVGVILGAATSLALREPPRRGVQLALGLISGAFLLFCWGLAMRA